MKKFIKKLLVNSKGTPRAVVKFLLFNEFSKCRPLFKRIVYESEFMIREPFKKWVNSEMQNPKINSMNKWPAERRAIIEGGLLKNTKNISVVTNQYTLFVANLMKSHLVDLEFTVSIDFVYLPEYVADLYLVICPQSFEILPPPNKRIVFQMEQSVSSRWFTREYFNVLYNSLAVFDYAKSNVEYLAKNNIPKEQIFYMPLMPLDGYPAMGFGKATSATDVKKDDVLFYGDIKNKRRAKFLKELQKNFKVRVENNLFGEELYKAILQAKVVVNIHYYEKAILESTRICECLSLGAMVVSEVSSNQGEHLGWEDQVIFTPVNDVQAMIKTIHSLLQHSNHAIRQKKSSDFQTNSNLVAALNDLRIGGQ